MPEALNIYEKLTELFYALHLFEESRAQPKERREGFVIGRMHCAILVVVYVCILGRYETLIIDAHVDKFSDSNYYVAAWICELDAAEHALKQRDAASSVSSSSLSSSCLGADRSTGFFRSLDHFIAAAFDADRYVFVKRK